MDSIKRIIKLSKSTALSILNKKKIDASQISDVFSQNDIEDILEHLSHPKIKKEREKHIKSINNSKHDDWNKIKSNIIPKKKKSFPFFYQTASILIVSLSLGYVYTTKKDAFFSSEENVVTNPINIDDNSIVLELDNGVKEIITADGTKTILNKEGKIVGVKNGTKLNYSNSEKDNAQKTLVYNQLTIPNGKVFQIVLSDGTKVHLNAGSSLKYPVNFIKGKNRTVFLKGEAFFDVKTNREQPFIVNTDNMNIQVLGTKFNVSSYPEDLSINTVLVEGSVSINTDSNNLKSQNTILKPGQKANWKKLNGDINIKSVNTSIYTSWIDGKIVFEHMSFKNILKKLERHYNVSITNNNTQLAEEKFTARFDVETIDQVLLLFSKNYKFNYSKKRDQITIN